MAHRPQHPDEVFPYRALAQMRQPCVYAWRRGTELLYVGTTSVGVGRFLGEHHVIGVREPLRPRDEIVIWVRVTERDRERLQAQLVAEHRPRYNHETARRRRRLRQRRCKYSACRAPFRPERSDQLYHTERCRNADWRARHPRVLVPKPRPILETA